MTLQHLDIGRESVDPSGDEMAGSVEAAQRARHLRVVRDQGERALYDAGWIPAPSLAVPSYESSVLRALDRAAARDALREPYRPDPDELPPFD